MKDGFIKVAVATPEVKVADCEWNTKQIISLMEQAEKQGVRVLVFPELSMTGYTCGDLFLQDALLREAEQGLCAVADATKEKEMFVFVGLPWMVQGKLYNTAAAVYRGEVLGLVPKQNIPEYGEFQEKRYFQPGRAEVTEVLWRGQMLPFGQKLLFTVEPLGMTLAAEICEDLWATIPPSSFHAMAGANVIVNLSASNEVTGKTAYRRELAKNQSARTISAYLYACAGEGESTTDLVFAGHNLIMENGTVLAETEGFTTGLLVTEIDLHRLRSERRRISSFATEGADGYTELLLEGSLGEAKSGETNLTRTVERMPFVPQHPLERKKRAEEIIRLQAEGLKKRLRHTGCRTAVIGISGGLDSTLALLVTCKAYDLLGLSREGILSVTMPCFGTTDRTYHNALDLARELGTTVREVPIAASVRQHFADIGHSEDVQDVTYENSQARERTQVLMDLANEFNGMVIGTGDLSELALGWATYNGDHMSMYGVNSNIPKTLVRYLVTYFADEAEGTRLQEILRDILDTPVSPELLPPKEGEIAQKTEDLVGPYELHDFFLYYVLRYGCTPGKILRLAYYAFDGDYGKAQILHWLKVFYRRFFSQQFKRSCLPDGPKVGSVGISPRGDWRMPSDACATLWLKELELLEKEFNL